MRIDTSEPSLVSLFQKGQVGLIRTEFMRKDAVIEALMNENKALMTSPCSRLLRAERDEVKRLKADVERLRNIAQDIYVTSDSSLDRDDKDFIFQRGEYKEDKQS